MFLTQKIEFCTKVFNANQYFKLTVQNCFFKIQCFQHKFLSQNCCIQHKKWDFPRSTRNCSTQKWEYPPIFSTQNLVYHQMFPHKTNSPITPTCYSCLQLNDFCFGGANHFLQDIFQFSKEENEVRRKYVYCAKMGHPSAYKRHQKATQKQRQQIYFHVVKSRHFDPTQITNSCRASTRFHAGLQSHFQYHSKLIDLKTVLKTFWHIILGFLVFLFLFPC